MLVSMGFPESRAIQALQQHGNVERAAEYLLTTQADDLQMEQLAMSDDSDQENQPMQMEDTQ